METETFPAFKPPAELIHKAYLHHAEGVIAALLSPLALELLDRFRDYPGYQRMMRKRNVGGRSLRMLFGENSDIWMQGTGKSYSDFLFTTHLAACCELMNGMRIPQNNISRQAFFDALATLKTPANSQGTMLEDEINVRFHSMDAVRTMQILRYLGLITRNTEHFKQLSLGAGSGIKDIRSLHLIPRIQRLEIVNGAGHKEKALLFETVIGYVSDVVIADGDKQHAQYYEELRRLPKPKVMTYIEDLSDTLDRLPDELAIHGWEARNLLVMLRIDHRMIQDVRVFFRLVTPLMEDGADLIVTIGSGHSLDEFEGRLRKLDEIASLLEELGMRPVRIRMHKNGSLAEQFHGNLFGISGGVTFEIIHCKLDKAKLKRLKVTGI
jgi:hypothetical protein